MGGDSLSSSGNLHGFPARITWMQLGLLCSSVLVGRPGAYIGDGEDEMDGLLACLVITSSATPVGGRRDQQSPRRRMERGKGKPMLRYLNPRPKRGDISTRSERSSMVSNGGQQRDVGFFLYAKLFIATLLHA